MIAVGCTYSHMRCVPSRPGRLQALLRPLPRLRPRPRAPGASGAAGASGARAAAGLAAALVRMAQPRAAAARASSSSASEDVVVFSRPGCAFCARAKALLTKRRVPFGVVDVAAEERREEAQRRSGATTLPQVFVGSRSVGGFDALQRLDEEGRLEKALRRQSEDGDLIAPTPPEKMVAAAVPEAIRQQLLPRVEAMSKLQYQAGSKPTLLGFLRYAVTRSPKQDQSKNVPLNLAVHPGSEEPAPALPDTSAQELTALLRQSMLQLLDNFSDPDSGDVDYLAMRRSTEWSLFRALAAELGQPRLQPQLAAMPEEDRKAFFINLYNAMTFHGVATFGRRSGWWYLYCFFITPAVSYRIAGVQMSLDDIEHGLLRAKPGYFEAEGQEFQRQLRMPSVDARIHMALNCGARSCPAVAVYSGEHLSSELDAAVAGFAADDGNVQISEGPKLRLAVTELFKMYQED
ncbi:unnamed protein product, partial [Effrenium voratum]